MLIRTLGAFFMIALLGCGSATSAECEGLTLEQCARPDGGTPDAALVVDVYTRRTAEVIGEQSRALVDMSTPIAALWDGVLMLPIVGE